MVTNSKTLEAPKTVQATPDSCIPQPTEGSEASQAEMADSVRPPTTLHLDKTPAASSEKGQPFLVSAKGVA